MRRASLKSRSREQARAGIIILVLVSFLVGLAVSALYYRGQSGQGPTQGSGEQPFHALSDSTKAVLKGLKSPVEIRFYALLNDSNVKDTLGAFAGRVDKLLAEYKRDADGKIVIVRKSAPSDAEMDAAVADGISPFNRERGEVCYLGIAVARGEQKESIPQLLPQWETALESDLTRAIQRLDTAKPTSTAQPGESLISEKTVEEVKRSLPNLAEVSLEDGTRILREAALDDLKSALNDIETQIKEAKQRLAKAQSDNSQAEQQAAMKQIQQSQALQAEKIKEIAARLQDQIAALEQLKSQ